MVTRGWTTIHLREGRWWNEIALRDLGRVNPASVDFGHRSISIESSRSVEGQRSAATERSARLSWTTEAEDAEKRWPDLERAVLPMSWPTPHATPDFRLLTSDNRPLTSICPALTSMCQPLTSIRPPLRSTVGLRAPTGRGIRCPPRLNGRGARR